MNFWKKPERLSRGQKPLKKQRTFLPDRKLRPPENQLPAQSVEMRRAKALGASSHHACGAEVGA